MSQGGLRLVLGGCGALGFWAGGGGRGCFGVLGFSALDCVRWLFCGFLDAGGVWVWSRVPLEVVVVVVVVISVIFWGVVCFGLGYLWRLGGCGGAVVCGLELGAWEFRGAPGFCSWLGIWGCCGPPGRGVVFCGTPCRFISIYECSI